MPEAAAASLPRVKRESCAADLADLQNRVRSRRERDVRAGWMHEEHDSARSECVAAKDNFREGGMSGYRRGAVQAAATRGRETDEGDPEDNSRHESSLARTAILDWATVRECH